LDFCFGGFIKEENIMPGLLEGVKVVAFDQVVALPATTAVMADWGAEVIKIEPVWGDWQRSL
jgi:crotonobetainyl-CoA:carnitine CoA-transferase CaiB-like acyl-CoA transferase